MAQGNSDKPVVQWKNPSGLDLEEILTGVFVAMAEGQRAALDNSLSFLKYLAGDEKRETPNLVFYYNKTSPTTGEETKYQMAVPLISIIPIPYISIKEADIDFNFRVNACQVRQLSDLNPKNVIPHGELLQKQSIAIKGGVSKFTGDANSEFNRLSGQVNIKMKLREQNMSRGMNVMLNEIESSIREQEVSPNKSR